MRIVLLTISVVCLVGVLAMLRQPGTPVVGSELRSIAALQCGLVPGTTATPPCPGGGSVCIPVPCGLGACGARGVGFTCKTAGAACPACTGGKNMACQATGPADALCYMTWGLCCFVTKSCFVIAKPHPQLTGKIQFSCKCQPGPGGTYNNRLMGNVAFSHPSCTVGTGGGSGGAQQP